MEVTELINNLHKRDRRALSRCISLVENNSRDAAFILRHLKINPECKVIGITGPPGAGKSTLVNALLDHFSRQQPGINLAVLAIDPTSPFTHGSLLGDRLRMNEHFNNSEIYIRSLATRGALGGLSAKTIEITDVLKSAGFDYIFIETVGVGQSEVEIAALADTTLVVFVPESGDEIQTIKSGIMEIADIFVVNKADREGADRLIKNLFTTLHERPHSKWTVPVVKTTATNKSGIGELVQLIEQHSTLATDTVHIKEIMFNKALRLAQNNFLKSIDLQRFKSDLEAKATDPDFNIYSFINSYFS